MTSDRQTAIAARAHQIWEEAGHPHGKDEQHRQQAEREYDEADARGVAVQQFYAQTVEALPAKPVRKRAAKAVDEAKAASVRKARVPRKLSVPAL